MITGLIINIKCFAQHQSSMTVKVDVERHLFFVKHKLIYKNESNFTIEKIVLNDWNNAFSSKTTPLANRFSDEFVRSFYFSSADERGYTKINKLESENGLKFEFSRPENHPDLIEIMLQKPLLPNETVVLNLDYEVKIPSDKFTGYGFATNGKMNVRNWYLTPARFENGTFISYSNTNTEDIANAKCDFDVAFETTKKCFLITDLNTKPIVNAETEFVFLGKNRLEFSFNLTENPDFRSYKNNIIEVVTDLKTKVPDVQKALLIDKMVAFVNENLGKYPHEKIVVSEADYNKYPFYGLNNLPSFLSPFTDEYIFEIKFLKTYLDTFLKNSLSIDTRKNNWIKDGFQIFLMMKYVEKNYPNAKMMGRLSQFKLLKSFNLLTLDFNQQYNYFYMLMVRENLDQAVGNSKDSFIKFNEQIALKYKAGLSLKYLDSYLENNVVQKSVQQFYQQNLVQQTNEKDLENTLKNNTLLNIDWFFNNIIHDKKTIDFKFKNVSKTNDSITFTLKNKTQNNVPVSVYGFQNNAVVFQKWFTNIATDSTFTIPRNGIDKLAINHNSEIPEYNQRNNYKKLEGFFPNNKPLKFNFMKDLEDPKFNQVLYVPTLTYNLYDGLSPGISFHNKTILDRPFSFNLEPAYSTATKSLTGFMSLNANQNIYNSRLYRITYAFNYLYSHYAPDAGYSKINPGAYFYFRDPDLRSNRKQLLLARYIFVNREKLELLKNTKEENYNVLNFKYLDTKIELAKYVYFKQDLQFSKDFGKISTEIQFRKLFVNSRQINLRLFAGTFLYNSTKSNYFSFALDRPTDYLFDYNYIGRSESTGLFSQQIIVAEGGFKSKLPASFANQLLVTTNASFNIWNWIEAYGDLGYLKNRSDNGKFVYDSGIRFNLVPDYFELYFPVHSNNGWEINDKNYGQKIRFVVTLSPQILVNLFTRRWF